MTSRRSKAPPYRPWARLFTALTLAFLLALALIVSSLGAGAFTWLGPGFGG